MNLVTQIYLAMLAIYFTVFLGRPNVANNGKQWNNTTNAGNKCSNNLALTTFSKGLIS